MSDRPLSSRRSARRWRYRIERTWGSWKRRVKVGEVVVDRYYGKSHHWNFMNLKTGKPTGGFYGVLIGEHKEGVPVAK